MSDTPNTKAHPDWLAVGAEVEVIRSHGRSVAHRRKATVARHTKTQVVLDNGDRFRRVRYGFNSEHYEQTPPYLDYRTRLAAEGGVR